MKTYLVGGAVRDMLLDIAVKDRDWVVVGASPAQMLDLGYKQVGKDFPVFIHPDTKEEYALARTERKTAQGYYGFSCDFSPAVTLEEDLMRRDLTINAMAQDDSANIIDPYNGQQDLQAKILRHVSPAFTEDPVRILRIARFAARFPDFSIAPESLELLKSMVAANMLDELVPERVWQEMQRAISEIAPARFFTLLFQLNALNKIMAPLCITAADLMQVEHLNNLDACIYLFILLYKHDVAMIKEFIRRLKIPKQIAHTLLLSCSYHELYSKLLLQNPDDYMLLFKALDVLRRPESLDNYIAAMQYIYPDLLLTPSLAQVYTAYSQVDISAVVASDLAGRDLATAITQLRYQAVADFLHNS